MLERESSTASTMNSSQDSADNGTSFMNGTTDGVMLLNVPYAVCEVLVAICAVIGNGLVILVFHRERRLRRRTNYYIVSLAMADLLVGLLGIPFAVLASVGLPRNLHACLFTVSLLVVLCTISIFCLVAVSVDRYWAILYPMGYARNIRTKTAISIIGLCWAMGTLIGFLPLLGWHANDKEDCPCLFTKVMDYNYLVFLYFSTIIFPALLLAAFYAHIYQVVLKQLRQIVTMNPSAGGGPVTSRRTIGGTGTMLRVLGAAQKREVKATQNLAIIVLFFIICWVPLYTINFIRAFCDTCFSTDSLTTLTNFCIILSHLNSAGNPLLYAYHLRDFRAALKNFLYLLFGIKEDTGTNNDLVASRNPFGSQNALQHHNINNTSNNNSMQSLAEPNQLLRTKNKHVHMNTTSDQDKSLSLQPTMSTTLSATVSPIAASISSIYQAAAAIPLSATVTGLEDETKSRTQMRTLTEVSSTAEDDTISPNNRPVMRPTPCRMQARGQVNSAYLNDVANLPDEEEEDDDVFIVSPTAAHRISIAAALDELPFRGCSSSAWEDVPRSTSVKSCCDEVSPPQLFLVEAEINNKCVDADDKSQLSTSSRDIYVINNCKGNGELKSDTNGTDNYRDDVNKSPSNPPSVKLSPLKFVGDFFFHSSNKCKRLKDDSDSCECSTELESDSSAVLRKNGSLVSERLPTVS